MNHYTSSEYSKRAKVTIFLGYSVDDEGIFRAAVLDGEAADIFDGVYLVPSNKEKLCVQDCFEEFKEALQTKLIDRGGYLYVCGGLKMVEGVKKKMEMVLGTKDWLPIKDRVILEVF
jgi:sulfite reductase alpha subunit-like flavoprotein